MQVLAHNLLAMNTDRQLGINTNSKAKSSEKLASGYRINRSADDAAGLQISEKMRWNIRGLARGEKNTQDGISWIQVADGAMGEMSSIIQRIRELAVQGSNDTNTVADRAAIDSEIKQLRNEINRISTTTEFNTIPVFDNSHTSMLEQLTILWKIIRKLRNLKYAIPKWHQKWSPIQNIIFWNKPDRQCWLRQTRQHREFYPYYNSLPYYDIPIEYVFPTCSENVI